MCLSMQVDSLEQVGSSIRVRMRIKGIPLWWIGIIIEKAVSSEVALLGEKAVRE